MQDAVYDNIKIRDILVSDNITANLTKTIRIDTETFVTKNATINETYSQTTDTKHLSGYSFGVENTRTNVGNVNHLTDKTGRLIWETISASISLLTIFETPTSPFYAGFVASGLLFHPQG